jgi:peptidoglycan/xylan/chitin deacetylase (PgdA/CDA1 family)
MLYGMDDEDEVKEDFEEFVEEKHVNIKKVLLAILIGIAVVVFFIFLIIISFNLTTQKVNITVEKPEDTTENIVQEMPLVEENTIAVQNNVEEVLEEIQIAAHDTKKLTLPVLPVENANGAQEIKDIYASDEKQVYLTFDDGPSKDITPQILDILKQYNVKATFFVLGARTELYPDTLKREFEEGHYIANHGYSHVYSKIYENKDTTFQEYVQTEQCIKDALGIQEYNSYLFRFPGGSSGGRYSKVKNEARELFNSYGVAFTNWNCLTGDAENKTTADACFNEMIRTKGNQNSVILLMHDANDKEQTVAALPRIIEYYMNEGYTFKNFYEIFREK